MVINKKKLMPYLIMVVMLLVPYLQFLVSGAATAKAASTETEVAITSGDAGSAKAYYSVDKVNHQINWRLRMNQVGAEQLRHAEFAIENVGTGLGEVTGLQIKDATTDAVTNDFVATPNGGINWQIGADAQTQKDYEVTFQTAYQSDSETTLQLKFAYKIEQAITETATEESDSATTATPAATTPAVTESSAPSATTETGTNASATEATSSDDSLQVQTAQSNSATVQPTAAVTQPVTQPTSYENVLDGNQVVTIAPDAVVEDEVAAEDDPAVTADQATAVNGDIDNNANQTDTKVKESTSSRDTKALAAWGTVTLGTSETSISFSHPLSWGEPDPVSLRVATKSPIKFSVGAAGINSQLLQYRTNSSTWTNVGSAGSWSLETWTGELNVLPDFSFITANKDENGNLIFKTATTDNETWIQFRVVGEGILGFTNVSSKINLIPDDINFELKVPNLDFGDINMFDRDTDRSFDLSLVANNTDEPFTLKAMVGTAVEDSPFLKPNLFYAKNDDKEVFIGNGGEKNSITILNEPATTTNQIFSKTFGVNVPSEYRGTTAEYTAPVTWKLDIDL